MIYKAIGTAAFSLLLLGGCGGHGAAQSNLPTTQEQQRSKNVMSETKQTPAPSDIKIDAKIAQSESEIALRYVITNNSGRPIYLLDNYPGVDRQSHTAYVQTKEFYLCKGRDAEIFVLRGIPPLPIFPVTVRVMPLGTPIQPGAHIEREFSVPTPIRERNDFYYAPAAIEEHTVENVSKLLLSVQILRDTVEGFHAEPAPYAPEHFIVGGNATVSQAESLRVAFDIRPVQLFVRKDIFTRIQE